MGFRLSSGWIGSGLGGLCDGGRRHVMASGWLGGNSGRCVVCGEAVCWQQTFSVGWEECVCVCGVGKFFIFLTPRSCSFVWPLLLLLLLLLVDATVAVDAVAVDAVARGLSFCLCCASWAWCGCGVVVVGGWVGSGRSGWCRCLAEFGGILVIWCVFGDLGQKTIFAIFLCQGSLSRSAVR